MLFLLLIVLVVATVATVAYILKKEGRQELPESQTPGFFDATDLRPLFAPSDAELRELERETASSAEAAESEDAHKKKLASFEVFRQTWLESATRTNTIELLFRASQTESSELYLKTVDELLHKRPEGFAPEEIAQLIESHFWLLPQSERTPGVVFTINRELAALRGGSMKSSEEGASEA